MKQSMYPLAVLIGGACFGILSTIVKLAYAEGFELAEVSGSQFLIGVLFIWLLFFFTKKQKISFNRFSFLVLCGVPTGLTGIFYYQSLQSLNASLAIIFLFQFVWIGTVIELIIDKKKPGKKKMYAILLLLIGSFLATGILSQGFHDLSLVGAGWGMLAALSFSSFAYISSSAGKEVPPIQRSAIFALGGLLITFIIFPPVFLAEPETVVALVPYGLLLGLFGVTLPPLLFAIGMPHVGAGLGTILTSSELPVALLMSVFILQEELHPLQWLGVCVIIVGIIYGNLTYKAKKENEPIQTSRAS